MTAFTYSTTNRQGIARMIEAGEHVAQFTTTAYGTELTGLATMFGWIPTEQTERAITDLRAADPRRARRAELRCRRAGEAAWDAHQAARLSTAA